MEWKFYFGQHREKGALKIQTLRRIAMITEYLKIKEENHKALDDVPGVSSVGWNSLFCTQWLVLPYL